MRAITFITFFIISQSSAEEWVKRCTYEKSGLEQRLYAILELDDLPIEVCISNSFSQEKINNIYSAFAIWNTEYINYVFDNIDPLIKKGVLEKMRNNTVRFTKIPVKLFTKCNKNQYPYILIEEEALNSGKDTHYLGKTIPIDDGLFSRNLHYIHIVITTDRLLSTVYEKDSPYFLDVVLHELGHAIGIPHIKNDNLMRWDYKECSSFSGICYPSNKAMEFFLTPYIKEIVK